jgi:hypothetical protein
LLVPSRTGTEFVSFCLKVSVVLLWACGVYSEPNEVQTTKPISAREHKKSKLN